MNFLNPNPGAHKELASVFSTGLRLLFKILVSESHGRDHAFRVSVFRVIVIVRVHNSKAYRKSSSYWQLSTCVLINCEKRFGLKGEELRGVAWVSGSKTSGVRGLRR